MPWTKNFDVDEALRKAGETFWAQGYDATSMTDLLGAMGIQKGSFYDTYGSKRDAYLRSLEQYTDERFASFDEQVQGLRPKEALRALIEAIHGECIGSEGHRGCMLINCALELAHSDTGAQRIVQRGLETHEQSFADLICAGQGAGEISAELDPGATAKALLALVMGMRIYSRAGSSRACLRTLADQALELIER